MPKGIWDGRTSAWLKDCAFEGCSNEVGKKGAKGFCGGHYRQLRLGKELKTLQDRMVLDPAPEGSKTCRRCKIVYTLDKFYIHKKNSDGMSLYCRECESFNKKMRTHGVSRELFDSMLEQQDNKCGICKETFSKQPLIDHDHNTGQVRGLLCHGCNIGLGGFRDTPEFLINAVWYLKEVDCA